MLKLVVTEPFGARAKGEEITEDVSAVLAAHPGQVVAVEVPDPAPPSAADSRRTADLAPDAGQA